mmetsp:Transcript_4164/g.8194  ORF Transcript_4164/g.8194 Transcript_4164/m.8194 type:complete len:490 (-) Transcript_4164:1079-2548(-)
MPTFSLTAFAEEFENLRIDTAIGKAATTLSEVLTEHEDGMPHPNGEEGKQKQGKPAGMPISIDLSFQGLDDDIFYSAAQILRGHQGRLERLELYGNLLTDISMPALCEVLDGSSYPIHLNIGASAFTSDGMEYFAPSLPLLRSLSLANTTFEPSLTVVAATALAEAGAVATSLTSLTLSGCQLGTLPAKTFLRGFVESASLRELYLDGNAVGEGAGFAIGKVLTRSPNMTVLCLARNNLTSKGANAVLAAVTTGCASLEELDLSTNNITDECSFVLEDCLTCTETLQVLDLSDNFLCDEAGASCGRGLVKNTSLTELSLSCNAMGDKAAKMMKMGLIKNKALLSLDVSSNAIKNSGGRALAEAFLHARGSTAADRAEAMKGNGEGVLQRLRLDGNHVGHNVLSAVELIHLRDYERARELIKSDLRRYKEEMKEKERKAVMEKKEKERAEKLAMEGAQQKQDGEGEAKGKAMLQKLKGFFGANKEEERHL